MGFLRQGKPREADVASFDWMEAGPSLGLLRLELAGAVDARSEPRLRVIRAGRTKLIDPLPAPAQSDGPRNLAFGLSTEVLEDPDASYELVAGKLSTHLPRPRPAKARGGTAYRNQMIDVLRRELDEVRAQLAEAEDQASDAFWHQATAEERARKSRDDAREARNEASEHAAREEQIEAELALALEVNDALERDLQASRELAVQQERDEVNRLRAELALVQTSAAQVEAELQRTLAHVAGGRTANGS